MPCRHSQLWCMPPRELYGRRQTSSLLQVSRAAKDDSDNLGAPAAAVYKGLYEKGEAHLEEARKTETMDLNVYQMLAKSMKDEISMQKDLDKPKTLLAANGEATATAEGDLEVTSKDLAEDNKRSSP